MQLHTLTRQHGNRRSVPVGRGSKRGKTSGRGTKGQKARAGRKLQPTIRDFIKQFPKLRGRGKHLFRSFAAPAVPVSLAAIGKIFKDGEAITPAALVERGIVKMRSGTVPPVKILSSGEFSKKVTVEACRVSAAAKEKIEKAGGAVKAPAPRS